MVIPEGDVHYGAEPWWDLFKLAVSEAAKRNIRFGFHSPGWSASGGPWITPELGMQELVWSEAVVDGGKPFEQDLPARSLAECELVFPREVTARGLFIRDRHIVKSSGTLFLLKNGLKSLVGKA